MSIRETFSNSIDLAVINEYGKGALMQISNGLRTFAMLLVKASSETVLLAIYLTTIWDSVILKIQNLWGSSFTLKYLKFKLDLKKAAKNWEKGFCFWDNCVWIIIVKLSLLRTGHSSSAANVLTSSPKILHVNDRNFSNSIDLAVIN